MLKGQSLKTAIGYAHPPPPFFLLTVMLTPPFCFLLLLSCDRSLAPGAQSLLKPLTDPILPAQERVDVKKLIRKLDIKDWALILRAFGDWPFAPEVSDIAPLPPLLGSSADCDRR